VVGDGDAVSGGDERLRLGRFVAVSGEFYGRLQAGLVQNVVNQPGGGAVVGPDPGVVGEVGDRNGGGAGESMAGG
jgi:hypothetical protein